MLSKCSRFSCFVDRKQVSEGKVVKTKETFRELCRRGDGGEFLPDNVQNLRVNFRFILLGVVILIDDE